MQPQCERCEWTETTLGAAFATRSASAAERRMRVSRLSSSTPGVISGLFAHGAPLRLLPMWAVARSVDRIAPEVGRSPEGQVLEGMQNGKPVAVVAGTGQANGAALAHRFVAHDPSNLAISIARAGENDCASTGNNDCAHTSMKANDLRAWIYLPEGYCERIQGGSKTPKW